MDGISHVLQFISYVGCLLDRIGEETGIFRRSHGKANNDVVDEVCELV